jgi:hypothetical protein
MGRDRIDEFEGADASGTVGAGSDTYESPERSRT